MNQGCVYTDRIDRAAVGLTVVDYYCQRYRHSGVEEWRSRIESGLVQLDGALTTHETTLTLGQTLTYYRPPWQEPEVPCRFDLLYEDEDLLVVVKPSGLPVMPGAGFLENTLLGQLRQRYGDFDYNAAKTKDAMSPAPIHRLGRGTSGLVLIARSPLAKQKLSQQMRDRKMNKQYLALCQGVMREDELVIEQAIAKVPHPDLGYLYGPQDGGLYSRSDVRVVERRSDSTLVEVTILTGRAHQIRIHVAWAGFPLYGDPLYGVGGKAKLRNELGEVPVPGDCGYWLHAYRLGFVHPRSGEALTFVAPAPAMLSVN
ncbi:MAG: RluA family pseudouridine synthase [Alkalinema sp. RU_4_3]|nr:RluA family pseudouridine synthase [Alkalinema sp. RU_4_3]